MQTQSCQVVIINEREILNVVTSRAPKVASRPAGGMGLRGAGSPPSGYGAEPRRKTIVSQMKKNITRQLITSGASRERFRPTGDFPTVLAF